MAKVSASLEAEAVALAGYKIEIVVSLHVMMKISRAAIPSSSCIDTDSLSHHKDLGGIVKIASICHPLTKTSYFWLGAVHKWRYILAKDMPDERSKTE